MLRIEGESSPGWGILCIRSKVISLYVTSPKIMHKDTRVFLHWLSYDSFPDSLPIFINCQKINHFPPVCSFLYFPPAHRVPSLLYSFSSFVFLPFVFSLFITFQRPPSHCPFLILCSAEKYLQQQTFFCSEWQETLLIQCSKDRWYNESCGWLYSLCQNKGWPSFSLKFA